MAIQLLHSRTAVPLLGNRVIASGFTHLGQNPYPTLGPGMQNTKGFSILYENNDPGFDKLMSFASVPTTDGTFPSYAYGPLTWDLENIALHCESREEGVPGDLPVPVPFFPPNTMSNPPPVYGRASYLIGASLGMLSLSSIGQIYPAGWNRNIALNTGAGTAYWFDPWTAAVTTNQIFLITTQDCTPSIIPRFVFPVDAGHGDNRMIILDSNRIFVYIPTGVINVYGRPNYVLQATYDCPGELYVAARLGTRFVCGITRDKVCWIFDVNQQVFWQVSSIPWPEADIYDNYLNTSVRICYDERRGRLVAHQPRSRVPGSDPTVFVGNKLLLFALVPVPKYITDPIPLDTIRSDKKAFWYTKVVGDHGELISNKRVKARLDDPVRGRLLSGQSATNARSQASFGYGGPEVADVGASTFTVRTDDGPGLPG